MKTSELTGVALDWAVAKCEGKENLNSSYTKGLGFCIRGGMVYAPSTDWAQGGPIIEREGFHRIFINVSHGYTVSKKIVTITDEDEDIRWVHEAGPTLLIAAMRCYVASKLGDTVDIHEIKGTQ